MLVQVSSAKHQSIIQKWDSFGIDWFVFLSFDESLWHSVDLEGLIHVDLALQQVLKTRVRRLRCPRAFVEELWFTDVRWVQQLVDLYPDFLAHKEFGFYLFCQQTKHVGLNQY